MLLCHANLLTPKTSRMQKIFEKREKKINCIVERLSGKKANATTPTSKKYSLREELPITVVIYAYNTSDWLSFNLDSAFDQEYTNYHIVYIDDASTDNTSKKVRHYLKNKNSKIKFDLITLTEHQGKLKSLYSAVTTCHDEEIVILLDACDWLANKYVLNRICKEYSEHDTWVTFGTATSEPKSCNIGVRNGKVPQEIVDTQQFRKIFPYSPTRSFYAGLFKKIDKNDLIDPKTNDFYAHAAECYIMWPILEMANTHFKVIDEVTYVMNCHDPIAKLVEDYHLRVACNSQMGKKLPIYQASHKPY